MAETSNESKIVGTFVLIIIIAIIGFVFIASVPVMTQWRIYTLNKMMKSIINDQENVRLRIGEKDLETMYGIVSETWNRRGDTITIPEKARIQTGWAFDDDGKPFCIRKYIIGTSDVIIKEGLKKHIEKPKSMTFPQYLNQIKNVIPQITKSEIDQYLSFYNSARFGSTSNIFDTNEYHNFQLCYNVLIGHVMSIPQPNT